MKKILFLLAVFICVKSFGQWVPQSLGSKNTDVYSKGTIGSDSGIVFRSCYADTSIANLGTIKLKPGILIRTCNNVVWMRDNTAVKWVRQTDTAFIISVVNDSIPNLQKVTDIGYTTTNPLVSYNSIAVIGADTINNSNSVFSPTKGVISQNINPGKNPALSWTLPWLSGTTDLFADSADSRQLQLPNGNGVLALSVNGIPADVNGNIIDTAHRTDTAFIIQIIHDSLVLRGPDTTLLIYPLYAPNDSTIALKADSLNELQYGTPNYDTTLWHTHTLIDKQYFEDRIGGISGGGGGGGLNIYNGDSSLSSDRTVDLNGKFLKFAEGANNMLSLITNEDNGQLVGIKAEGGTLLGQSTASVYANDDEGYGFNLQGNDGTATVGIQADAAANSITHTAGTQTFNAPVGIFFNSDDGASNVASLIFTPTYTSFANANDSVSTALYSILGTGIANSSTRMNTSFNDNGTPHSMAFALYPDKFDLGGAAFAHIFTITELGIFNLPQGLQNFANNASALGGGLVNGDLYRNGDGVNIVH